MTIKNNLLLLLLIISITGIVSARGLIVPDSGSNITYNYSLNTNYSNYSGNAELFDGYSVSGLYSYYKGLLETYFNGIYAPISSLANYLPLSGGIMTGNLTTSGNITADTYYGDGSQLTGIQSEDLSNIFYEYYTSSRMNVVIENLSSADVSIINEIVQPGNHYIYGEYLE
jgi:hypothetical protein